MTEKRKRGRPRKVESFQALKDIMNEDVKTFPPSDSEIKAAGAAQSQFENKKTIVIVSQNDLPDLTQRVKKAMENMGIKPLLVTHPEKLIPPEGLSKIQVLEWLTTNRKR